MPGALATLNCRNYRRVRDGWASTRPTAVARGNGGRDSDPYRAQGLAILEALEDGVSEGWIEPLVVHELTYVLSRLPAFRDRAAVHRYLQTILLKEGVQAADKSALLAALTRWRTEGSGFVDSWLAVLAWRRGLPVCSVHAQDFPDLPNTFSRADV